MGQVIERPGEWRGRFGKRLHWIQEGVGCDNNIARVSMKLVSGFGFNLGASDDRAPRDSTASEYDVTPHTSVPRPADSDGTGGSCAAGSLPAIFSKISFDSLETCHMEAS